MGYKSVPEITSTVFHRYSWIQYTIVFLGIRTKSSMGFSYKYKIQKRRLENKNIKNAFSIKTT